MQSPAKTLCYASPCLHDVGMKFDPYGVGIVWGSCPQVRLRLTRGYKKYDPYGVGNPLFVPRICARLGQSK